MTKGFLMVCAGIGVVAALLIPWEGEESSPDGAVGSLHGRPAELSAKDLFGSTYILQPSNGFKLVEGTEMELTFFKRPTSAIFMQKLQGGFRLWFNAGCNSFSRCLQVGG